MIIINKQENQPSGGGALPKELKLDESEVIRRRRIIKDLASPQAKKDSPIYDNIREFLDFETMALSDGFEDLHS